MNKKYFYIKGKFIPFIYGGMPYTPIDFNLPLRRESLPDDRDTNIISSTDYFYGVLALGEGPIYAINPNGPQDLEFNDAALDDLIDFNTNTFDNTKVATFSVVGNPTAKGIPREFSTYFNRIVTPQSLSSPLVLRYGNLPGIPATSVTQDTSGTEIDSIDFSFTINALYSINDEGTYDAATIGVQITLANKLTGTALTNRDLFPNPVKIFKTGSIQSPTKFHQKINIYPGDRSSNGYQFKVEKITSDSGSSKQADLVVFNGWEEIVNSKVWYPRTALLGIVLKSYAEYSGNVPSITSLVKGLMIKVPSNYNQPILEDGTIDWRQLESPRGDDTLSPEAEIKRDWLKSVSYVNRGYYLENQGTNAILKDPNPVIYPGIWDGTFVIKWSQNPVWVIYDLLTDTAHGLGISEEYIDKFKFYKVAQYCDGVNSSTGKFEGVAGYSDGTFRYKPRGYTRQVISNVNNSSDIQKISILENQIGLPAGTPVRERRFVCNISINNQSQVVEIINQITAIFRGVLIYSGGKISINVDLPDELPVAVFNETSIIKDSFQVSGIKESEILTGVEVSYLDPTNHYKREIVKIDDPKATKEIPYVRNVDLAGCDRRSQAMRFGQYLIASSKYIRRKVTFKTTSESINLSIGDVISVQQKMSGISWGYGGRIAANTATTGATHLYSNAALEHFTTPAITASVFSGNTKPLALRIINRQSDKVNLYLLSNTIYKVSSSGNTVAGADFIEVKVTSRLNPEFKTFETITRFDANATPIKNDIWSLGEVDPTRYASSTSDKLFKIVAMDRDDSEFVTIQATEYISNVYVDSDSLINYSPARLVPAVSPITQPPPSALTIVEEPLVRSDGSLIYNIRINTNTNTDGYPFPIQTEILLSEPDDIVIAEEIK